MRRAHKSRKTTRKATRPPAATPPPDKRRAASQAPPLPHRYPRTTKRFSRRRYKVEYLPEAAQAFILGSFVAGKPYHQISTELRAQGVKISANALCRYWRECWEEEYDFLRHARACVALIAQALKQDPNGDLARIGRELLYTMVFQKARFFKQADPFTLLHEAREIDKIGLRARSSPPGPPPPSAMSDEELDRKIRAIYGLPEPQAERKPDDGPHRQD